MQDKVSTLGKIFAFIVLVSAVAFVMAAYVLSQEMKNWKLEWEKLDTKYKEDTAALKKERDQAVADKTAADTARQAAETKRAEYEKMTEEQATALSNVRDELTQLKKAKEALDISFDKISQELKVINDKNVQLLADNQKLLTEKEDAVKARKKAEDDLAREQDDNRQLREQMKIRTSERDGAREKLAAWESVYGDDGVRLMEAAMKQPAVPMVNGLVNNADNQSGIVEVTLGKDDGLSEGQTLEV
ncbi:MAG TPA: hypothetical protein VMX57_02130, partial [Planctomycetota bacterium]|nr:hypothetical protein [Planctomycetota bacterium]